MEQSYSSDSILALLLSFVVYREALLKVLKEMHVSTGIIDSTFKGMVSLVLATNQVSFLDDELPLEGRDRTLAMHIYIYIKAEASTRCCHVRKKTYLKN